jgi:hypothetical protein
MTTQPSDPLQAAAESCVNRGPNRNCALNAAAGYLAANQYADYADADCVASAVVAELSDTDLYSLLDSIAFDELWSEELQVNMRTAAADAVIGGESGCDLTKG